MILTYTYRLLPSKVQHRALESILESQRQLYNAALEERIGAYRKANLSLSYVDQTKSLTVWRGEDPDASTIPLSIQRATLKRLDEAYKGFFRRMVKGGTPGFPRFKGKGWFDSFGFREYSGITLDGHVLCFKGMPSRLRVHFHRPLPTDAVIRSCTIRREVKGWTVGFALRTATRPEARETQRRIGIDLGITTLAMLSDGSAIPSLRAARRAEGRMRTLQRALARKRTNSRGRKDVHERIRRQHAATARRRLTHLHQASAHIVNSFEFVAVEGLKVSALARGVVAKDVHDASWATLLALLRYKAERAGIQLVEVDPSGTSQECSRCFVQVPKRWDERIHKCSRCGLCLDRDINAARNVLKRAEAGPRLANVALAGMRSGKNLKPE